MSNLRLLVTAIVLCIVSGDALAAKSAKKLTFEQAWKKCTPVARQLDEGQGRTARGKSCMLHYGYRI